MGGREEGKRKGERDRKREEKNKREREGRGGKKKGKKLAMVACARNHSLSMQKYCEFEAKLV